jgi:phosphoribosyl-ATP pyrophosphohydrolase
LHGHDRVTEPTDILDALTRMLEQRRAADPATSYVASLYADGTDRILKKVAEEAGEVLLAAKNANPTRRDDALVGEVADLWFHTLVLLIHLNQQPGWVLKELERRFGVSGHTEKAGRTASQKD